MTAKNDVTGDRIATRASSEPYRQNFGKIDFSAHRKEEENQRINATMAEQQQQHEIQQILGKALRYPWYCDDQKAFPDSTKEDGVCVGKHIAESLASEAADVIENMRAALQVIDTWARNDCLVNAHVIELVAKALKK